MPVQIIVLNGASSVGKTSTAKAFQSIARLPFLHVSMDAFFNMLPTYLIGHPDGLLFQKLQGGGNQLTNIIPGPIGKQAMIAMRHSVAAMAGQGIRMIVDIVMMEIDDMPSYRALLSGFETRYVGMFASLEVCELREKQRGNREIGLNRWQRTRLHRNNVYDLSVNTDYVSPIQVATIIANQFDLGVWEQE